MSRWIDADAMKKAVEDFPNCYNGWSDTYDKAFIIGAIEEQPSIDMVRCKECKHRYNDGWIEPRWTCDYLKDMRLKDDDYCSYGERREP